MTAWTVGLAAFLWGCSALGLGTTAPATGGAPDRDGFARAVSLVDEGAFAAADSTLRALAERCDNGDLGRRALLLLASVHQDPRNAEAAPDTAALMAARYLYLPDGTPEERVLAQGLYVRALDQGADPGLRPDPALPGVAPRFSRCSDGPPRLAEPVALPVLSREPYAFQLRALERRLDSLAAVHGSARRDLNTLRDELERIRRLLQATDTVGAPGP